MTRPLRPSFGIAFLLVAQFAFLFAYTQRGTPLQFWDYAMYANMAMAWFSQEGSVAWTLFKQSFDQKYNLLYAVPSLLGFSVFGAERNVFILTNFVAFFVPYQLACAWGLRQIFGRPWSVSLLLSLALCLLVPFGWYPLFQGYPDHGAAACLIGALALLLGPRTSWRKALLIGCLMGLSILLRRHYAYPVLAVLVASGLFDIRNLSKNFRALALHYSLVGVGLLGILVLCEPAYLQEIVSTNYGALYKSYDRGAFYFTAFTLSRAGIFLLLTVSAGYALYLRSFSDNRKSLVFFLVLFFVWLALWSLGPAQAGEHYLISLFPFVCVVGLAGLFLARGQSHKHRVFAGLVFALLAVNSLRAFWFGPFVLPTQDPVLSVFSAPRPPWVRTDMSELRALATYIAQTTTDQDKVVVAGSSFIFNQDLTRALYTDILKYPRPAYRFLQAPESDGEQEPPLDAFASANVYLVASPTQYHLPADGQKVVTGLTSLFPPQGPLAGAFTKDTTSFRLMEGVIVEVWRRSALNPQLLHETLQKIRALKDTDRLWVTSQTSGAFKWGRERDKTSNIIVLHGAGTQQTTLFYDAPMRPEAYRFSGQLHVMSPCEEILLTGKVLSADGRVLGQTTVPVYQPDGAVYVPLAIRDQTEGAVFLSVQIQTKARTDCTVALWQLGLEQYDAKGLSGKP